jgi:hypothetical protein
MQRRLQKEDQLKEVITSSKGFPPPPGLDGSSKRAQLSNISNNNYAISRTIMPFYARKGRRKTQAAYKRRPGQSAARKIV